MWLTYEIDDNLKFNDPKNPFYIFFLFDSVLSAIL